MADTATQLARLIIEEVSGVDDPANQIPGHMVQKDRTAALAARAGVAVPVRRASSELKGFTGFAAVWKDGKVSKVGIKPGTPLEESLAALSTLGFEPESVTSLGTAESLSKAAAILKATGIEADPAGGSATRETGGLNGPTPVQPNRHRTRTVRTGQFKAGRFHDQTPNQPHVGGKWFK